MWRVVYLISTLIYTIDIHMSHNIAQKYSNYANPLSSPVRPASLPPVWFASKLEVPTQREYSVRRMRLAFRPNAAFVESFIANENELRIYTLHDIYNESHELINL